MPVNVRLMQQTDLAAVVALQDSCYSDALYESPALLQQRLAVAGNSCWLAENSQGQLLAYLFSYLSLDGAITPLAAQFTVYALPELLYLHDMAVSPKTRGMGLAASLLNTAKTYAQSNNLTRLALVAVQGSVPYWQRQGFAVVDNLPTAAVNALNSYQSAQARYMQCKLGQTSIM